MVLLVLRLLGRFVSGVWRGMKDTAPFPAGGRDMVRDRICNTFLPRERALTALVAGHEEHFCSASCRDRALRPL